MSRRNRSENPVTLFAFQDIITSVTGILILITLILALALADRPVHDSSEIRESIEDLRSQLAALDHDINSLQQQTRSDSAILDLMSQYGANSIEELISHLTSSIRNGSNLIRQGQAEATSGEELLSKNEKRLSEQALNLQQLMARLHEQQKLLDRIVAGNRVVYQFSGSDADQPWLLELGGSVWQIARANKKEKPVRFEQEKPRDRLKALVQWSNSHSGRKYLVLLVRPGGVEAYDMIRKSGDLGRVEFGVDLISSDVTVIDSETGAVAR
jgi:hypothetical protein